MNTLTLRRSVILSVANFFNSLGFAIVLPFLSIYFYNSRSFSMDTVGLILSSMGAGVLIGPPISGWLVDYSGRRMVLQLGLFLRGGAFLLLAIMIKFHAMSFAFALVLLFISVFGLSFQNASDTYLTDFTSENDRPKACSWIRIGTNMGFVLGPLLGTILTKTSLDCTLIFTSSILFLGGVFVGLMCPEISSKASMNNSSSVKVNWLKLIKDNRFFIFLCFSFSLYILMSQLYSIFSIYATNHGNVTKGQIGIIYSINGLVVVLLQLPLTHFLDQLKLTIFYRLGIGAMFYFIAFFITAFCGAFHEFICFIVLLSIGEIIVLPAIFTCVSIMAAPQMTGRYMGMSSFVRGLGYTIGPWLGAVIFRNFAYNKIILWSILSSFGFIAGVGFLIIGFSYNIFRNKCQFELSGGA
ncbi:MFS transporter [Lentisphaerota bacterium ZTH]|nr:MFS transporter [Lentisphaerota bacterium]WET06965.1 MFS transporter [Lentisphaerota bacterium ZTH]